MVEQADRRQELAEVLGDTQPWHERRRPKQPRPLLVSILVWVAPFAAFCAAVFLFLLLLAAGKEAGYSINGRQVTRKEFLASVLPVLIPILLVGLGLAYAIWRERPWSRHLVMAVFLAMIIAAPFVIQHRGRAISTMIIAAAWLGLAFWYFYLKRNVAAYYDDLKRRREQDTRKAMNP